MCTVLPRVKSCCFCFSPRTGSLIIGYFSILAASAGLGTSTVATVTWLEAISDSKFEKNPHQGRGADVIKIFMVPMILVSIFYFAISLLLVSGAHTNNPRYMRPYCFVGLLSITLNLTVMGVTFMINGFMTAVYPLVACAVMLYVVVVIRSSYLEMEERSNPPAAYQMVNVCHPTTQAPLVA